MTYAEIQRRYESASTQEIFFVSPDYPIEGVADFLAKDPTQDEFHALLEEGILTIGVDRTEDISESLQPFTVELNAVDRNRACSAVSIGGTSLVQLHPEHEQALSIDQKREIRR